MDRTFTCPTCGYENTYQPEECALFTRYRVVRNAIRTFRVRLVYCPG